MKSFSWVTRGVVWNYVGAGLSRMMPTASTQTRCWCCTQAGALECSTGTPQRWNEKTVGRAPTPTTCLQELRDPSSNTNQNCAPHPERERSHLLPCYSIFYKRRSWHMWNALLCTLMLLFFSSSSLSCPCWTAESFTALATHTAGWPWDTSAVSWVNQKEPPQREGLGYSTRHAKRALQKHFTWFLSACFLWV